jgi:hypothetical protein
LWVSPVIIIDTRVKFQLKHTIITLATDFLRLSRPFSLSPSPHTTLGSSMLISHPHYKKTSHEYFKYLLEADKF